MFFRTISLRVTGRQSVPASHRRSWILYMPQCAVQRREPALWHLISRSRIWGIACSEEDPCSNLQCGSGELTSKFPFTSPMPVPSLTDYWKQADSTCPYIQIWRSCDPRGVFLGPRGGVHCEQQESPIVWLAFDLHRVATLQVEIGAWVQKCINKFIL